MDIKTTKTVEAEFTVRDLKKILAEKLNVDKDSVSLKEIMKTEYEPGFDPHDSFSYDVFAGIKVTYKE